MKETWKDVENFNGLYKVSSLGKVLTFHGHAQRLLKHGITTSGYATLALHMNGYCERWYVHRLVAKHFCADYNEHLLVDHINRNKLDNNYLNLRAASHSENKWNTIARKEKSNCKYKGVYTGNPKTKYRVKVSKFGKQISLGQYDTAIAAALAYDKAMLEIHGEFASTNKKLGLLPQKDSTHDQ